MKTTHRTIIVRRLLTTFILAAAIFTEGCGGCGGSSSSKDTSSVRTYCKGADSVNITEASMANICCAKNAAGRYTGRPALSATTGVPAGCPQSQVASLGTPNLEGGISAVSRAQTNLGRAAELVCKGEENCNGEDVGGEILAATAQVLSNAPKKGDQPLAKDELAKINLPNLNDIKKPSAGPGGSGGASSGQLPNLQVTPTAPANDGSGDVAQLASSEVAGATYSGGAGAGSGGSNEQGSFSNPFGRNGADGAGANGKTVQFGDRRNASASELIDINDPDDYFGRINIYADLFKIVERRYRQKAMTWQVQKASALASE